MTRTARAFRRARCARRWRSFARVPRCPQQRGVSSIEKGTADNSAKGRWNGGSFTPGMEESPCPHRSLSSAFSLQASPRASPSFPPTSPHTFPQPPSLPHPSILPHSQPPPLHPCSLSTLLIASSLFASVRPLSLRFRFPLSLFPPPLFPLFPRPQHRLVSLAKKFTFAKKREKSAKNRFATPIGRVRPGPRRHWSAARFWAWLKDELSLCHRLYWSYTIRCVRSTHRCSLHSHRATHAREPAASRCISLRRGERMHTYVRGTCNACITREQLVQGSSRERWVVIGIGQARKRYRSISSVDITSMTPHLAAIAVISRISAICTRSLEYISMLSIKMLRALARDGGSAITDPRICSDASSHLRWFKPEAENTGVF